MTSLDMLDEAMVRAVRIKIISNIKEMVDSRDDQIFILLFLSQFDNKWKIVEEKLYLKREINKTIYSNVPKILAESNLIQHCPLETSLSFSPSSRKIVIDSITVT